MLWHMTMEDWVLSFSFITCVTFICGWVAHNIMGSTGFGVVGNWLLTLLGVYTGMYAYNLYGYQLEWYPIRTLAVMAGSGCMMLLSLTVIKRLTFDR